MEACIVTVLILKLHIAYSEKRIRIVFYFPVVC